jgi:epoxyqueuosine reductase
MTAAELSRLASEVGLDVVGASPAEPYVETERHIRDRRARGLFGGMRFTTARPEVSCHPERLVPSAKSVISAARCYFAPGPAVGPGEGRLARYTWRDEYAELRVALDRLGKRLGGSYRVLVDSNDHVDREAAVRAGIAFYGKNTMAITARDGSWVVLGTLVTDVEVEPTPRLELDCGSCTACIDACPTGALDEPGVLDATRCLSYSTQAPIPIPEKQRAELGDSVYGCDICQEVCPWNGPVGRRRASTEPPPDAMPAIALRDWLERDGDGLVADLERLFVPRNDARWLRRNALVAAGNVGEEDLAPLVARYAESEDAMLSDTARWALSRMAERVR